jgi:hypothetical protein
MSKGEAEANAEPTEELPLHRRIGSAIDFGALDNHTAAQVTGGVVPGGFTGPYAALTLASGGARHLLVHGHGLKRIELDGTKVDLFVEEAKVGSFTVNGGDTIDCDCAIPDEIAKRTYVAVRFVATDFAYAASDSRQFVVFALEKVELTKS